MSWRDEKGIALIWAAAAIPVILLAVLLAADILQWQATAHGLQTAVDAAALAGAQEVWVRQEVDAAGQVWSQTVYLNEDAAHRQALAVLDANLARLGAATFTVGAKEVAVDQGAMTVRVTVRGVARALLADRLGLVPPAVSRAATAQPVLN